MQRTKVNGVLSSKWGIYVIASNLKFQRLLQKRGQKGCRRWGIDTCSKIFAKCDNATIHMNSMFLGFIHKTCLRSFRPNSQRGSEVSLVLEQLVVIWSRGGMASFIQGYTLKGNTQVDNPMCLYTQEVLKWTQ